MSFVIHGKTEMLDKTALQCSFFDSKQESKNNTVISHIVIPTSVEHYYENLEQGRAVRNALYIKEYAPTTSEQNPIVFFHGGPEVVNQEQFSVMQNYFTQRGHSVYIPEIEGSTMYAREGNLPEDFEPSMIDPNLKLLELNRFYASGLNEFTKNYADDVKDVLDEISRRHPNKKINIIAHSLGAHQVLRTLQHYPHLNSKIEAISNIAGTSNVGANRFFGCLKSITPLFGTKELFECHLEQMCLSFIKSPANENQAGPKIDKQNNPSVNQQMNQEVSVIYGDLSHFPPILLLHAADDSSVFFQGTLSLQQKIQQSSGIAHGLYFPSGGHQFIKNEGNPEIRLQALEAMEGFFKHPTKKIESDISQLNYEDVHSQHQLFLQDKDLYLNKVYPVIEEDEDDIENAEPNLSFVS